MPEIIQLGQDLIATWNSLLDIDMTEDYENMLMYYTPNDFRYGPKSLAEEKIKIMGNLIQ